MSRLIAKKRSRRPKGDGEVKLNITPMMDIFTIILVFLLKIFSAQGQLVTPAEGLTLPTSSTEKQAVEALSVQVLSDRLIVEKKVVLGAEAFQGVMKDESAVLIQPLFDALKRHADEAKRAAALYGRSFSGQITIHGDSDTPYSYITRIMYTCGQAGYHDIKLLAYREE